MRCAIKFKWGLGQVLGEKGDGGRGEGGGEKGEGQGEKGEDVLLESERDDAYVHYRTLSQRSQNKGMQSEPERARREVMRGGEREPTVSLSLMDRLDSVDRVGRPEDVVAGSDFGNGEHAFFQPQMGVGSVVEFLTCNEETSWVVNRRLFLRGSERSGGREGRGAGGGEGRTVARYRPRKTCALEVYFPVLRAKERFAVDEG